MIGELHCAGCGITLVSVWPSDCEVLKLECGECGLWLATFTVAFPLVGWPSIEGLYLRAVLDELRRCKPRES